MAGDGRPNGAEGGVKPVGGTNAGAEGGTTVRLFSDGADGGTNEGVRNKDGAVGGEKLGVREENEEKDRANPRSRRPPPLAGSPT